MAWLATVVMEHIRVQSQWDPNRFRPQYDSDSDDPPTSDHVTAQSPAPRDPAPTVGGAVAGADAGAAAPRPPPGPPPGPPPRPLPPAALSAPTPIQRSTGWYAEWGQVGNQLEHVKAAEQVRTDAAQRVVDEKSVARQLGLRQAELKDYEHAKAALIAHGGVERLAEYGSIDLAQESAKAFLWSHNVVASENNVLKRNLARTEQTSSNPWTSYRENADETLTFAQPTSGDCATLEHGFVNIVPERAMQTRVGWWVDPRTNLVSEVYEDLPPPAQGDWSTPPELRDADNSNRQLVRLQGGYDPHNPPPVRRDWEADAPVPEPTNGDAAWALQRRERELRMVIPDVAMNKNMMFDQSEIDRYPDGYVGYQNQRPYADLLGAVPATLRGQPGSGWGVTMRDKDHEDFAKYAPGTVAAASALGCGAAVSAGDRSAAVDRMWVEPVGGHEPRLPHEPSDGRTGGRETTVPLRLAEARVAAPAGRAAVLPPRAPVTIRPGHVGAVAVGGAVGCQPAPAYVSAADLPRMMPLAHTAPTRATVTIDAARAPTAHELTRRAATVAPGSLPRPAVPYPAAPAQSESDAQRLLHGRECPATRVQADHSAEAALAPHVTSIPRRADAAVHRHSAADSSPIAPGVVPKHEVTRRADAAVHRHSAVDSSPIAPGVVSKHEVTRRADGTPSQHVGAIAGPAGGPVVGWADHETHREHAAQTRQADTWITGTTWAGTQEQSSDRDYAAQMAMPSIRYVAGGAVNAYPEHVRAQDGQMLGPNRTMAAFPRSRGMMDARIEPTRQEPKARATTPVTARGFRT